MYQEHTSIFNFQSIWHEKGPLALNMKLVTQRVSWEASHGQRKAHFLSMEIHGNSHYRHCDQSSCRWLYAGDILLYKVSGTAIVKNHPFFSNRIGWHKGFVLLKWRVTEMLSGLWASFTRDAWCAWGLLTALYTEMRWNPHREKLALVDQKRWKVDFVGVKELIRQIDWYELICQFLSSISHGHLTLLKRMVGW